MRARRSNAEVSGCSPGTARCSPASGVVWGNLPQAVGKAQATGARRWTEGPLGPSASAYPENLVCTRSHSGRATTSGQTSGAGLPSTRKIFASCCRRYHANDETLARNEQGAAIKMPDQSRRGSGSGGPFPCRGRGACWSSARQKCSLSPICPPRVCSAWPPTKALVRDTYVSARAPCGYAHPPGAEKHTGRGGE